MEIRRAASTFVFTITDSNPLACQLVVSSPSLVSSLTETAFASERGYHSTLLRLNSLGTLINCLANGLELPTSTTRGVTDSLASFIQPGNELAAAVGGDTNSEMEIEGGADETSKVFGLEDDESIVVRLMEGVKLAAEIAANFVLTLGATVEDSDVEDWASDDETEAKTLEQPPTKGEWEYAAAVLLGASRSSLSELFAVIQQICEVANNKALPKEFPDILGAVERVCSVVTNISSSPSVGNLSIDIGESLMNVNALLINRFRSY